MMTKIEHPEIRYVVYSIRRTDGTLNGKPPSMRHDPNCTHYNFRGGKRWGTRVWRRRADADLESMYYVRQEARQVALRFAAPRYPAHLWPGPRRQAAGLA